MVASNGPPLVVVFVAVFPAGDSISPFIEPAPVFDSVRAISSSPILHTPLQFVVIAIGMTQPDAIQYNCPHSARSLPLSFPPHPRSLAHTDIPIPFILPRSLQPPLPMPD